MGLAERLDRNGWEPFDLGSLHCSNPARAHMLFETKMMGFKCTVYEDRVTYKPLFGLGGEQTIPMKQIASVDVAAPGVQQITIETTGGKKFMIPIRLKDKEKVRDAILANL